MKTKVLLVEDNDEFRKAVHGYLKSQSTHFEIEGAKTGDLAIKKAGQMHPDIVILDIQLPQLNGIDAAEYIKRANPEGDIIVLTVFKLPKLKPKFKKGIITAFLEKSELHDRLMTLIKRCLKNREVEYVI